MPTIFKVLNNVQGKLDQYSYLYSIQRHSDYIIAISLLSVLPKAIKIVTR